MQLNANIKAANVISQVYEKQQSRSSLLVYWHVFLSDAHQNECKRSFSLETSFWFRAACFACMPLPPPPPSCLAAPRQRNVTAILFCTCNIVRRCCWEELLPGSTTWRCEIYFDAQQRASCTRGTSKRIHSVKKSFTVLVFNRRCCAHQCNVSLWCCGRQTLHPVLYVWQKVVNRFFLLFF